MSSTGSPVDVAPVYGLCRLRVSAERKGSHSTSLLKVSRVYHTDLEPVLVKSRTVCGGSTSERGGCLGVAQRSRATVVFAAAECSDSARGPHKANVNLISTARGFGSTKEGDRGLWFVVGQAASRLRNAGVETDFLALYAHALGNRDWERELATLGRATRNVSAGCKKKKRETEVQRATKPDRKQVRLTESMQCEAAEGGGGRGALRRAVPASSLQAEVETAVTD